MGSGNIKAKNQKPILEENSFESLENEEKIKAVLYFDNEELSKHEDLFGRACFYAVPKTDTNIFSYEQKILSQKLKMPD